MAELYIVNCKIVNCKIRKFLWIKRRSDTEPADLCNFQTLAFTWPQEYFCALAFPMGPGPKMASPLGNAEMGLGPYARPLGDNQHANVPDPPSGRFLRPWFPHLWPGPKMAPR